VSTDLSKKVPALGGRSFASFLADVDNARAFASHAHGMVLENLNKGVARWSGGAPDGPRAWTSDPLDPMLALGYKDRRSSIAYDMIADIAANIWVHRAIVKLITTEILEYCEPYRDFEEAESTGFEIIPEPRQGPSLLREQRRAWELEADLMRCGDKRANPYAKEKRHGLDTYMVKTLDDSLTFDQIATEKVLDGSGRLFEFYARDARTFRLALNVSDQRSDGRLPVRITPGAGDGDPRTTTSSGKPARYIQIVNRVPVAGFAEDEILWSIRNPRSNIYVGDYGWGEIEQLVAIVDGIINTEKYHNLFFKNGTLSKGILALKGTERLSDEQFEAMRRQMYAQVRGVNNAHGVPFIQFDGDVQWVDMQAKSRETEGGWWYERLIAIFCALHRVEPSLLNVQVKGGVTQTPLFEASSSDADKQAARERFLRPMLRFVRRGVLQPLLDAREPGYVLRWRGIGEVTDAERLERRIKKSSTYMKLDEVRKEAGLPAYGGEVGNMPMNPTLLQAEKLLIEREMAKHQAAVMRQQAQDGGPDDGDDGERETK
jgi:hypothetical protein